MRIITTQNNQNKILNKNHTANLQGKEPGTILAAKALCHGVIGVYNKIINYCFLIYIKNAYPFENNINWKIHVIITNK